MLRLIVTGFIYSGIRDIDVYYKISNTNGERDYFRDKFIEDKVDEITFCSVNINGLWMKEWKAKNN